MSTDHAIPQIAGCPAAAYSVGSKHSSACHGCTTSVVGLVWDPGCRFVPEQSFRSVYARLGTVNI